MKRVLVLGATGFVGSNICNHFTNEGIAFEQISRSLGVDLRDPIETRTAFKALQPEWIVNCAAHVGSLNYVTQQAAEVVSDNTRMILSMYEAVHASCPNAVIINPIANCAYPANATTFIEDEWWDGHLHRSVLSYGTTRRLLWSVAECFNMQHGIRSVHFLVPNMYGPFDSTDPNKAHALNALISKFVKAKHEGCGQIEVWGTGVAIREWLLAYDFARLITKYIQTEGALVGLDEPLNVGQNFGLSVRELISAISKATEFEGVVEFDPTKPDGAPRKVMDDRRFRRVFADFQFTKMDDGIAETIKYYTKELPY